MDTHVKLEGAQNSSQSPSVAPPPSSGGPPMQAPPPSDQGTNGMEFCDVSEKDLEGGFDDVDNMDCN